MKKLVLLVTVLGVVAVGWGQPPDTLWTRILPSALEARAVQILEDGSFAIAGTARTGDGYDDGVVYFWRLDSMGVVKQARTLPRASGMNYEKAYDLERTSDNMLLLSATTTRSYYTQYSARVLKLDTSGSILWEQVFGRCDTTHSFQSPRVVPDSSNGFFLIGNWGYRWSTSSARALRSDSTGDTLWMSNLSNLAYTSAADGHGGFAVGGHWNMGGGQYRAWIATVDSNGNTTSSTTYTPGIISVGYSMIAVAENRFVLAGFSGDIWPQESQYLLIKTGTDGWVRSFGDADVHRAFCVTSVIGGGYALAGDQFWVVWADEDGNLMASGDYHHEMDVAYDVKCTHDGGLILVGGTNLGDGIPRPYIVRTAPFIPTSVSNRCAEPSSNFTLSSFPNPFNPSTTLSFTLPKAGRTTVVVYDLMGRKVESLSDEVLTAGEHTLHFDGLRLPSGIYFARMQSGDYTATQKLLLLK